MAVRAIYRTIVLDIKETVARKSTRPIGIVECICKPLGSPERLSGNRGLVLAYREDGMVTVVIRIKIETDIGLNGDATKSVPRRYIRPVYVQCPVSI